MEKVFIMAGIGGQGLQLAGKILVKAANDEGKEIVFFPIYGGQKRGGVSSCYIIISDSQIGAPIRGKADYNLIMDPIGFENYKNSTVDEGHMIINTSMISDLVEKDNIEVHYIPFNEISLSEVGNSKTIGILALGYLIGVSKIVRKESVVEQLKDTFNNPKVLDINIKALNYGIEYATQKATA